MLFIKKIHDAQFLIHTELDTFRIISNDTVYNNFTFIQFNYILHFRKVILFHIYNSFIYVYY